MDAHLLLVEDEPNVRAALNELLSNAGYAVHQAESVNAALKHLAQRVPSIVLTGHRTPNLDGAALAMTLASHPEWSSIPVLLMSATRPALFAAKWFIPKPVQLHRLIAALQEALAGK